MKKLLVAILALLYISTSTGAIVHLHYCMGKLSGWDFGHMETKSCDKCGMEKSIKKDNGCCKDEHKFIKNDTDQKAAENAMQMFQDIAVALPASFFEMAVVDIPTVTEKNPTSHAPPQSDGIAVYIRNCVFLI